MSCRTCGAPLARTLTDLPFKTGKHTIIVVKDVPVLQCEGCQEYLLEDSVMSRIDAILSAVDAAAEVEVVRYAA